MRETVYEKILVSNYKSVALESGKKIEKCLQEKKSLVPCSIGNATQISKAVVLIAYLNSGGLFSILSLFTPQDKNAFLT